MAVSVDHQEAPACRKLRQGPIDVFGGVALRDALAPYPARTSSVVHTCSVIRHDPLKILDPSYRKNPVEIARDGINVEQAIGYSVIVAWLVIMVLRLCHADIGAGSRLGGAPAVGPWQGRETDW